jgi:hypothetical protein
MTQIRLAADHRSPWMFLLIVATADFTCGRFSPAAGFSRGRFRLRPVQPRPVSHGISVLGGKKGVIFDPFSSTEHGYSVKYKCHIQDMRHLNRK